VPKPCYSTRISGLCGSSSLGGARRRRSCTRESARRSLDPCAPTTFRTKTDAKRYLASVRTSGSDPPFGKLTVETALWTFAESGCRWGEVHGLRVRNVNLAESTIQIEQELTRDSKGAPILGKEGDGCSPTRPAVQ
jgi:integrase